MGDVEGPRRRVQLVTGAFLVDTEDIAEAEAAIGENFGAIAIGPKPDSATTLTRIWRTSLGRLTLDEAEYTFDLNFTMEPTDQVILCRVRSGQLEESLPNGDSEVYGPGQVVAFGARDAEPFAGVVRSALYDVCLIDREVLDEVAPPHHGGRVGLTSAKPTSFAANQLIVDTVDFLRHSVMCNPHVGREQLLSGSLTRYLASAVLSAFPNDVPDAVAGIQHRDDAAVLVRRAESYIDDNAHTDISMTDIAAAANVTPDVLQMMFVRNRECTPMEYLRRVRLHHAHLELTASDPLGTSVAAIAARWGFANPTRFGFSYRLAYGRSPKATLRNT